MLAVRCEWLDDTADGIIDSGRFPDALAIEFPLKDGAPPTMGSPEGKTTTVPPPSLPLRGRPAAMVWLKIDTLSMRPRKLAVGRWPPLFGRRCPRSVHQRRPTKERLP